jgi:hypothetical protein
VLRCQTLHKVVIAQRIEDTDQCRPRAQQLNFILSVKHRRRSYLEHNISLAPQRYRVRDELGPRLAIRRIKETSTLTSTGLNPYLQADSV